MVARLFANPRGPVGFQELKDTSFFQALLVTRDYKKGRSRAKACKYRFSERKGTPLFQTHLPEQKARSVLQHLSEGCGVRQTGRLLDGRVRRRRHRHPPPLRTGLESFPSSGGTERVSGTHPERVSGTHLDFQNGRSGQEWQLGFTPISCSSWISSTRESGSSRHSSQKCGSGGSDGPRALRSFAHPGRSDSTH
jgi:hypothetical protein